MNASCATKRRRGTISRVRGGTNTTEPVVSDTLSQQARFSRLGLVGRRMHVAMRSDPALRSRGGRVVDDAVAIDSEIDPVSYTHLTLPTIYSV